MTEDEHALQTWKEWGCPCPTLEEHKEHLVHLKRCREEAAAAREKNWKALGELLDALKADRPKRPHLRLIRGGKQ